MKDLLSPHDDPSRPPINSFSSFPVLGMWDFEFELQYESLLNKLLGETLEDVVLIEIWSKDKVYVVSNVTDNEGKGKQRHDVIVKDIQGNIGFPEI